MQSDETSTFGFVPQRFAPPKKINAFNICKISPRNYYRNNGISQYFNKTNSIKRYPYHLICGKRYKHTPESEFEDYVRSVLREEGVNPEDYKVSTYSLSVFIDFALEEDMERVLHNHKYEEFDGAQISFNKKYKKTDDKKLYFIGLPENITRNELDHILTETYNLCVHEVTRIVPSYEDQDLMFATVYFEFPEDAVVCFDTVKEINGYPIKILLSNNNDISSSSSGASDFVQKC